MSEPKRTTKETHPHLPPGLILDKDGKVCKVCNSWQDFAGIKVYKKDPNAKGGSSSGSSGSGSKAGAAAGGMAGMMAAMSAGSSGSGSSSSSSSSSSSTPATSTTSSASAAKTQDRSECPADTVELGRSTWTFLHTTAAYYPDKPTPVQKTHMVNLLSSLPSLYPCTWCADDFGESIKANPPQPAVESATKLNEWLCRRHNEVNKKLGKPEFACDWKNIMRRWKDGPEDGSCD
ncbi:hypothetical protein A1Q1_02237 [Trichosporon asahii var. asahii CBS 2479]|uniref:Sulfhydryl oxidase n=1 Tax=Trichosporon asahii var. asahii (strain ATCC 90039 / CBS 2479 / JCM 2466 / KCTC 7840 / NBRC 103889/ NCYC 2677 / UAMH 7654) TaxID=1186058 RepID=J6F0L5_TRIAS|nr:hypothetical protein A1Q1_02237 [Trichosporon asahii var. asahii CBS 2479]EJT48692.1 hypothetical protein A1Q1_02237 [Trichosporon asahii var. asahii CBS 2479]